MPLQDGQQAVSMDSTDLHVDSLHFGQDDYALDLSVGAEVADLDFDLNTFTDVKHYDSGAGPVHDGSANSAADIEVTLDETKPEAEGTNEGQADSNPEHDVSGDMGMEFGDEISYDEHDEDDAHNNTEIVVEEVAVSDPKAPTGAPEEQVQQTENGQDEASFDAESHITESKVHILDDDEGTYIEAEGVPPDDPHQEDIATPTSTGSHQDDQEEELDLSDIENHIDGDGGVLSRDFPEVEVDYNGVGYALFGREDDDPDSYFLSNPDYLDGPLSELLAAIRAVLGDEITARDEITASVSTLSLDFGERSSPEFLARSLRQLIDCHAVKLSWKNIPHAKMPLRIRIRHDPEQRFVSLLSRYNSGVPTDDEDGSSEFNYDENIKNGPSGHHHEQEDSSASHSDSDELDEHGRDSERPGNSEGELQEYNKDGLEDYEEMYFDEFGLQEGDEENGEAGEYGYMASDHLDDDGYPMEATGPVEEEEGHTVSDEVTKAEAAVTNEAVTVVGAVLETTANLNGKPPGFFSQCDPIAHDVDMRLANGLDLRHGQDEDFIDYSEDEEICLSLSQPTTKRKSVSEAAEDSPAKRVRVDAPNLQGLLPAVDCSGDWQPVTISIKKRKIGAVFHFDSLRTKRMKLNSQVGPSSPFSIDYSEDEREDDNGSVTDALCADGSNSTKCLSARSSTASWHSSSGEAMGRSPNSTTSAETLTSHLDFDIDLSTCSGCADLPSQDDDINLELGDDQALVAPDEDFTGQQDDVIQGTDSHITDNELETEIDVAPVTPPEEPTEPQTSTTSTVDGDEINYEDDLAEEADLAMNQVGIDGTNIDIGNEDEIDWRDGLEEETALAGAQSPSDVSVKRHRTDEEESLADEADNKRRRI